VTFFIAYSLEDVMFNQQLLQANEQLRQQQTLPSKVNKIPNLSKFGETIAPNKKFMEFDDDDLFGEFSHEDKHYHYMKLSNGLLLMDVTEQVVVKRGAKDILSILLVVFLLCIAISVLIARAISAHALKPFHRLSQHFQQKNESRREPFTGAIDIEEADVKAIAEQLEQALAKQTLLIEEQVAFNQGMSHEIRTPLQVMSHSLELIEANHTELYQQPLMQRFVKSLARIKRISNALLWLTSKEQHQGKVGLNKVLDKVLLESKDLASVHSLDITLNNVNQYQPTITMPDEVLELIFLNLLNNAIHHGVHSNDSNLLTITIDKHAVIFSNEIANITSEQQHFNLGLNLITKLAERFNSSFVTQVTDNQFNATLSFDKY
jgi:signal transduction histidine kinase